MYDVAVVRVYSNYLSLVTLGYDHNDKDTVNWRVESEDGDDDDDDNGTSNHFSGVVLPEERRMASSVEEIDGKLTKQDELTVCLGNNNKPARSKIGDERPIKPGIGWL